MILFGRELHLDQIVGLVECNATPDKDLVHRAALEIIAALRESQRRERAAVEDMETFKVHSQAIGKLSSCTDCKHCTPADDSGHCAYWGLGITVKLDNWCHHFEEQEKTNA